jgi:hypothetical protein
MSGIFRAFVLSALLALALGSCWAAYAGIGAGVPGAGPSVRSGSVGGPRVVGGGPRSGK